MTWSACPTVGGCSEHLVGTGLCFQLVRPQIRVCSSLHANVVKSHSSSSSQFSPCYGGNRRKSPRKTGTTQHRPLVSDAAVRCQKIVRCVMAVHKVQASFPQFPSHTQRASHARLPYPTSQAHALSSVAMIPFDEPSFWQRRLLREPERHRQLPRRLSQLSPLPPRIARHRHWVGLPPGWLGRSCS